MSIRSFSTTACVTASDIWGQIYHIYASDKDTGTCTQGLERTSMSTLNTAHMTSLAAPPQTRLWRLASTRPSTDPAHPHTDQCLTAQQQNCTAFFLCQTACGVGCLCCSCTQQRCRTRRSPSVRTDCQQVLVACHSHACAHILRGWAELWIHIIRCTLPQLVLDLYFRVAHRQRCTFLSRSVLSSGCC